MKAMNERDYQKLKRLIDQYGLANVIEQLGAVCAEKASQCLHNEHESLNWENASHVLIRQFAEHRSIKLVSP